MATTSKCILAFISFISIQLSYSTITTLSTDCGNLVISCNEPDIKCCQGACCSLLSQYQNREPLNREDETENALSITPYVYQPTPPVAPPSMPQVGEGCTSKYARGERCAGTSTKCRFDDYDSNGYLLGVCCVEHELDGCTKDADCCRYDGVCANGQCTRDLPPPTITNEVGNEVQNIEDNTPALFDDAGSIVVFDGGDAAHDEVNGVQSARSHINIEKDVENNEIDLHEENRSKPNYELWVSLSTSMALFVLILFISLCALNCWLYRNYYKIRTKKRTMNANGRILGMDLKPDRECDVGFSDSTDYEDSVSSA